MLVTLSGIVIDWRDKHLKKGPSSDSGHTVRYCNCFEISAAIESFLFDLRYAVGDYDISHISGYTGIWVVNIFPHIYYFDARSCVLLPECASDLLFCLSKCLQKFSFIDMSYFYEVLFGYSSMQKKAGCAPALFRYMLLLTNAVTDLLFRDHLLVCDMVRHKRTVVSPHQIV